MKQEVKDEVVSIKSRASTPDDGFQVDVDLCLSESEPENDLNIEEVAVSPAKLGDKHYIFERVTNKEYCVTMRNEDGGATSFRRPEFRTFGIPYLGPEKSFLLIPSYLIVKFKMGKETSADKVFLTVYVDLTLPTSIVAYSFVNPAHIENSQKTEKTVFHLAWGAKPQSYFRRQDGGVVANELIDLSVHGRNEDSRFSFFAHVVDDLKFPTMLNNRLILGRDFFMKYLKTVSGSRDDGYLYLLDQGNRAYKAAYREKIIH